MDLAPRALTVAFLCCLASPAAALVGAPVAGSPLAATVVASTSDEAPAFFRPASGWTAPPAEGDEALPAGRWHVRRPDAVRMLAVGRSTATGLGSSDPEARSLVDQSVRDWLASWLVQPLGGREGLDTTTVRYWDGRWAVVYRRTVDGIPVAGERVAVTLSRDGAVCALSVAISTGETADYLTPPDYGTALAIARGQLGADGILEETDRGPVYFATADEEIPLLVPARRVEIRCEEPFGRWLVTVAGDGRVLEERDLLRRSSVTGRVDIVADEVGYCDGSSVQPAGLLDLSVLDARVTETTTLLNGTFLTRWFGAAEVTVQGRLEGPYVRVDLWNSDADAFLDAPVLPDVENVLAWDDGNSRRDERDAFHFVNRAHDEITLIDPAFRDMDFAIATYVGITDSHCPGNAWYDHSTLNFCEAGSGMANMATIGSVVYHEYAHGITDELYGLLVPPGDVDEGNSDVYSNLLTGESLIARGFWTANCSAGVRNSDNNLVYPEDWSGENHDSGRILAGVFWDVWEGLGAVMPADEARETTAALWHGSRVLGLPMSMPEQVTWIFVADDDNGDLTDGTPHWPILAAAARHHGFEPPPITYGIDIVHTPLVDTLAAPFHLVAAHVTSAGEPLDTGSLKVFYDAGAGWVESPLLPYGGPDDYAAAILAPDGGATVSYYLQAADVLGRTVTLPAEGADDPFTFSILGDTVLVHEDFETDTGWTVGWEGDDAYVGFWERAVPQLVDGSGVISQPGADTTPDPGTICWVTGAAVGSGPGSYDVDGGTTSLVSPVYDLRTLASPCVQFDAWIFSGYNTTDLEPMSLLVSDDAGVTWTTAMSAIRIGGWERFTVPLDGLIEPGDQVRFRFVIQDPLPAALVEALVDEFEIIGFVKPDVVAPVVTITTPRGRVIWPVDTVKTISWTATDDGVLARSTVVLSRDGGLTYPDTLLSRAPWTDHFDWLVTGPGTSAAQLKVRITDQAGNTGQAVTLTPFTILAMAPGTVLLGVSGLDDIVPNPFNPSTTVAFRLREAQPVDLAVYDLAGRLVRRLASGTLPAGAHRYVWDGRDERGEPAGSGIYLLRLVSRDIREMRKLTLLK